MKFSGYHFSGGRELSSIDTTIVAVTTDDGLTGWGVACPCGNNYLTNFPAGIRAGLEVVYPQLIGADPLGLDVLSSSSSRARR